MHAITQSFSLLWDALFLKRQPYARLKADRNPFVEGLFILAVLGVTLGLLGIVGSSLQWASSPSFASVRDTVWANLQQMPWFTAQSPEKQTAIASAWNSVWKVMRPFAPTPANSLLGIVTKPLGLIVVWLVYGVLAHGVARALHGTGTLNQTLGVTALAAAPQLLNLVTVIPFVQVAGLVMWSLLCSYVALRTVHELNWRRSAVATVIPALLLFILLIVAAFVAGMTLLPLALGTGIGGTP